MNFVAHHVVARRAFPDAPPLLFIGNLLPDLATLAGNRRLRPHHLADITASSALADGARLHFAADRWFHTSAAFVEYTREAGARLKAAPFAPLVRRRFFVAHVLAEVVLDGVLVRRDDALLTDLYDAFAAVPPEAVADEAQRLTGEILPDLPADLRRFTEYRFLENYRTPDGMAQAIQRINARAGIPNFAGATDENILCDLVTDFLPVVESFADALITPPPGLWYNFTEYSAL